MKLKILSICILSVIIAGNGFGQKMKAEDILARHLDAIGSSEARAAAKTLIAVGEATAKFVSTKDQTVQGRIVMASEGAKNFSG